MATSNKTAFVEILLFISILLLYTIEKIVGTLLNAIEINISIYIRII